jgi:hypothetical protein
VTKLIGGLAWLLMLAAGNLTPVSAQENAPAWVLCCYDRPHRVAASRAAVSP